MSSYSKDFFGFKLVSGHQLTTYSTICNKINNNRYNENITYF